MFLPFLGGPQILDFPVLSPHNDDVFDGMRLLFPTVILLLFLRVLRPLPAPFRSIQRHLRHLSCFQQLLQVFRNPFR